MKDRIVLREIEFDDISQINKWRNDKSLIDFLGSNFFYISEVVDRKWYESYLNNRDKAVRLAIVDAENGTYIGNVNLTSIHAINNSAEFSVFIGDKNYWSKGLSKEIIRKVLSHAFLDLNLNRIYLMVLSENERAIKSYLNCGFKCEGTQREAVYKCGEYKDLLCMAILKSEFI